MPVIHYQNCPVCGDAAIQPVMEAKDHTVSGEIFSIWQCNNCKLRFTQDVPDAGSIGPYYQSENYISHSDTKKGLVNSAYHLVRQYTLKQKRKLVQNTSGKNTGSILDLGAGTGAFLNEMKEHGWTVTGLEPDAGARKHAHDRYGLSFADAENLFKLNEKSFDIISMWHVLEHVHDLHAYINQIRTLLVEGGLFILALPNYTSDDAAYYRSHWAAYDVPRHLYHFSPLSVRTLLAQHGLEIRSMHPMWFDSFYISMLSEQYKKGKQGYISAFVEGIRSNKKALSNTESASSIIYCAFK
ncbi:class I SAM-dependent methyltransferase [Flavihumibacter sp.]|uniref:class I SAM-dependent methyltransferase n=1 Tax=Flavihumibacter sp. TaxID=1913981 RepID=UPI002FC9295B